MMVTHTLTLCVRNEAYLERCSGINIDNGCLSYTTAPPPPPVINTIRFDIMAQNANLPKVPYVRLGKSGLKVSIPIVRPLSILFIHSSHPVCNIVGMYELWKFGLGGEYIRIHI
jgi:hypothetical protein